MALINSITGMTNLRRGHPVTSIATSQSAIRRRKLPLSQIIVVFLFVTILVCAISMQTIMSNLAGQSEVDLTAPQPLSQTNQHVDAVDSKEKVVIAHAISLIKCSKSASVTGFLDAAAGK